VTSKGELKKYQNAKGEGVLFSFELTDDSGSIRLTGFRETAEKTFEIVQMGKVYAVSKTSVKPANRQFNRSTSEYEMTLNYDSSVELVEDDGSLGQITYKFKKISDLDAVEVNTFVDVIGVVTDVGDIREITTKAGEQLKKREITLVDDSNRSIQLTLWRDRAEAFNAPSGPVPILAIKAARRGEYNGAVLGSSGDTGLEIDVSKIPEAEALRAWYMSGGKDVKPEPLSAGVSNNRSNERRYLGEVKEHDVASLDPSDSKGAYFTTRAYIMAFRKEGKIYYTACPETAKKVTEAGDGQWLCEATGKYYDHCDYRYILGFNVHDVTNSAWFATFNEGGEALLGRPAQEMAMLQNNDPTEYDDVLAQHRYELFSFRVRVKQEEYNGEVRPKYNVMAMSPVEYAAETKLIVDDLAQYHMSA